MADALPGRPSPLGATPRDGGINFAVASSVAEAAEVCLFDDGLLVLVNAWWEPLEFTVGDCRPGLAWRAEIDTFDPAAAAGAACAVAGDRVTVGPRSVLVLRGPRDARGPKAS